MVRPDKPIPVIQHHAVQVLILSVEAHLNVTLEVWAVLGPVRLLDLIAQQAGHALNLHLPLPDENLQARRVEFRRDKFAVKASNEVKGETQCSNSQGNSGHVAPGSTRQQQN